MAMMLISHRENHAGPAGAHVVSTASPDHLGDPLLALNLKREIAELWPRVDEAGMGHMAKTLVRQPTLRVSLMVLRRGSVIREHRADAAITLQTLSGRVALSFDDKKLEFGAGEILAAAPRMCHDVEALEDSAVLLTLSWHTTAEASPSWG